MQRLTGAIGALLLLLAPCVATGPGAPVPEKNSETSATAATLGLVTQDKAGDGLHGRPVDPLTLADLPGYEAIDFGHHYTSAISPDGRTLALVTWPEGWSRGGILHLIELPAWNVRSTGVSFNHHLSSLHFSADGSALYWVEPRRRDAAHGIPRAYQVYRYALQSAQTTAVTELSPSFTPWETRLLPAGTVTGQRLAIYDILTGADNLAEGAPRVLLVDLAAGTLAANVRLEGVTAGQFRVETAEEGQNPYRMVRPALAWDVVHGLLYVVHGDEEKITVVDLEKAEVRRQVDIRPRQSILERILGWGAGVAEAKVMPPGANKQAALSPDGSRLYVTGLRREMVPPEDGDGLYLVSTESMEVSAHLLPEQEVYLRGFSADGGYVYVSTGSSEWLGDHYGNWTVTLHLLDLQAGRFVAEREFPGYVLDVIQ